MLHLAPQPAIAETPPAYAEAVSRLESVRHTLRLVEPFAGGPADDIDDAELAIAFANAREPARRLFDRRASQIVGATAAGVEALLIERQEGREPNRAASEALVEQIRSELREVAGIVLG